MAATQAAGIAQRDLRTEERLERGSGALRWPPSMLAQDVVEGFERAGHLEVGELRAEPVAERGRRLHRGGRELGVGGERPALDRDVGHAAPARARDGGAASGSRTRQRYGRRAPAAAGAARSSRSKRRPGGSLRSCRGAGHWRSPSSQVRAWASRSASPAKVAAVEEALPQVADGALDLALGLRAVGAAGADPEAPVGGEAQELGVFEEPAAAGAAVLEDDGLELVEEQLARARRRSTAKAASRPVDQGAHRLAGVELQPQEPRVAEHEQQGEALAPGQPHLREVHLALQARGGLEADDRLRRAAPAARARTKSLSWVRLPG